jgi:hypothetical protein
MSRWATLTRSTRRWCGDWHASAHSQGPHFALPQALTREDEHALEMFLPPSTSARQTLADVILEKIRQKEAGGPAAQPEGACLRALRCHCYCCSRLTHLVPARAQRSSTILTRKWSRSIASEALARAGPRSR